MAPILIVLLTVSNICLLVTAIKEHKRSRLAEDRLHAQALLVAKVEQGYRAKLESSAALVRILEVKSEIDRMWFLQGTVEMMKAKAESTVYEALTNQLLDGMHDGDEDVVNDSLDGLSDHAGYKCPHDRGDS